MTLATFGLEIIDDEDASFGTLKSFACSEFMPGIPKCNVVTIPITSQ